MINRILHLFEWSLNDITKVLKEVSEQGFNAVQISPIQPLKEKKTSWWLLYQPLGFQIGNDLGTKEDLIELCNKANDYNIRIICDVVCNHVADDGQGILIPHEKVDKELIKNSHFWKEAKYIWNWDDRREVINYCLGLPSLNLSNYNLQDIIINFLNELIECGVRGFRFDAAKNIALPNEGSQFWTRVLESLKHKEELFNYAEVIFSDKELIDKYCKYVNVLTDSFGSHKDKMVTFVESHDTYYEFKSTRGINDELMIKEYEVLTQNFKNTLFYSRPFSALWKDERIKNINERC